MRNMIWSASFFSRRMFSAVLRPFIPFGRSQVVLVSLSPIVYTICIRLFVRDRSCLRAFPPSKYSSISVLFLPADLGR